ncbi:MAG: hypothetical protein ACRC7N_22010 [Clostridium sp.]
MLKKLKKKKISKDDIGYEEDVVVNGICETSVIEGNLIKSFSFNDSKKEDKTYGN